MQRMRAAEAARGHPAGGTNFKMFEPAGCKVRRVRSFAVIRRKVLNAPALDEQLAFFSLRAGFAQHLGSRREHDAIYRASAPRTYGDTAHARDTGLFVHPLGIVFIDSANGTHCGAGPAGGALLCGLRAPYRCPRPSYRDDCPE